MSKRWILVVCPELPRRVRAFFRHVGIVVLAAAISSCSVEGPEARLASAKQALERQDSSAATVQLKSLLQEHPELVEARYLLGKLSVETGDFATAERELRRAGESAYSPDRVAPLFARALIELNQPDKALQETDPSKLSDDRARSELNTYRARALLSLDRPQEASKLMAEVLRSTPDLAAALVTHAQLQALGNDPTGALQTLNRVLASNERDVEALMLKATIDKVQGRDAQALEGLARAVAVAPGLTAPRSALASMLLSQGKLSEARIHADELRKRPGGELDATVLDAQIAYREKKFEQARNAAVLALKVDAEHLPALAVAASSEYALGNLGPAESSLQKIIRQSPAHAPSRKMLAEVLIRQGNFDAAQQVLQPLLGAASADVEALDLAGQAALQAGDLEAAQALFRRVSAANPGDVRARASLAASLVLSPDAARGISELEKLGAQEPDQHASDIMLVLAHLRAGAWEKALAATVALERKQPDNPLTHNLRGTVLGAKANLPAARQAFERALALNPRYAPAAVNLAKLDALEGKPEDARQRLERFLAGDPSSSRVLIALAELKARAGAPPEEVRALLEKARTDNPRLLPPRLALVQWYVESGEHRKAIDLAQQTEWTFPNNADVLLALGRVQLASGDAAQALNTYRKLTGAHERRTDAHLGLAHAQVATGDFDGARKSLERVLQLDARHLEARLGLIEVEALAGRIQNAMAMSQTFIRAFPKLAEGHAVEGDLHARGRNFAAAAVAYGKALSVRATTPVAIKAHDALLAAGQQQEADKLATQWSRDHPKDGSFRLYLAQRMLSSRDYEGAKRAFLDVLALQPETSGLLNNLAWACYKTQDPRALAYAERAHKLAPHDASVLDTLGVIRLERGETEAALALLAQAATIAPKAPSIRYNHATALARAGKKVQARRELEEALDLKIPFDELSEARKLLATL